MLQWLIGLDVNPGRRVLDSQLVVAGLGYFLAPKHRTLVPQLSALKSQGPGVGRVPLPLGARSSLLCFGWLASSNTFAAGYSFFAKETLRPKVVMFWGACFRCSAAFSATAQPSLARVW